MNEPEFQIIEHRFDIPFRTRGGYGDYTVFPAGSLHVYMNPKVAVDLRALAERARPQETGGLLSGRILRDDAGPYVVVTGMIEAPAGTGDLGRFELSAEGTEELRARLARRQPSADVIGWWHSHMRPSKYSPTDHRNQELWSHPHHLGLLVFAEGKPWCLLYVGPDAHGPVAPSPAVAPTPKQPPAPPVRPGPPHHPAGSPETEPPSGEDPTPRLGGLAARAGGWRRLVAIACLALLAGYLVIWAVDRALTGGDRTDVPPPGSQRLNWSCVASPTGFATCRANSDYPVRWYLGHRDLGEGPWVVFRLPNDRPGIVRVVVLTPEGSYGDELTLEPAQDDGGQPGQQWAPPRQGPSMTPGRPQGPADRQPTRTDQQN
jgi:hypothetical protein